MPAQKKKTHVPEDSDEDHAMETRSEVKARKKKERERAELEDAERISGLPRRSKEKAKKDKVWLSSQSTRSKKSETVGFGSTEHVGEKRSKRNGSKKADSGSKASRTRKNTLVQASTKQKTAARPILDRSLLEDTGTLPLAAKQVIVKPLRQATKTTALPAHTQRKKTQSGNQVDSDGSKSGSDSDSEDSESNDESDDYSDEDNSDSDEDGEDGEDDEDGEDGEDDEDSDEDESSDKEAESESDEDENEDLVEPFSVNGNTTAEVEDRLEQNRADDVDDDGHRDQSKGKVDGKDEEESPRPAPRKRTRKRVRSAETRSDTKRAKKQKRLEDRPRMKDSPSLSGSDLEDEQHDCGKALSKKKKPHAVPHVRTRSAPRSRAEKELEYRAEARLVYNGRGGVNLNHQSQAIRNLTKALIEKFRFVLSFKHGFLPAAERFQIQRDIAVDVAKDLKISKYIVRRLRSDSEFVNRIVDVPELRDTQFRSSMKTMASKTILADYGIPVMVRIEDATSAVVTPVENAASTGTAMDPLGNAIPAFSATGSIMNDGSLPNPPALRPDPALTKLRVEKLLIGLAYAHPGVIETRGPSVDPNKAFDRASISELVHSCFFKADKRGRQSIAARHGDAFTSSDYYRQHEKEIPESMLGLACASIALALEDWSTGTLNEDSSYSTSRAQKEYDVCMGTLAKLRETQPDCYHRALHNVYLKATGGQRVVESHDAAVEAAMAGIQFNAGANKQVAALTSVVAHPPVLTEK